MKTAPARRAAFNILLKTESGSYACDLLRAAALDSRDAGLASQLVFGVLRFRAQLDFLIEHDARTFPPSRLRASVGWQIGA